MKISYKDFEVSLVTSVCGAWIGVYEKITHRAGFSWGQTLLVVGLVSYFTHYNPFDKKGLENEDSGLSINKILFRLTIIGLLVIVYVQIIA
ncbi:hypothetical protein JXL21_12750 [Candidatus Bathyarchaeota archaeon]|nr:hypothetical protein [Candidatus Bathyarchaeota archaeon]